MTTDLRCLLFAATLLVVSGCTEMRVEGDARVFQTSATGGIIRTGIGLGLLALGAVSLLGGVLPDRKPRRRKGSQRGHASGKGLSSAQRAGLVLFGGMMGAVGLALVCLPLVFPHKRHVTVYPDRVEMASTYSQTGGNEVVVPFSDMRSVEIRNERSPVGKLKSWLVITMQNGDVIRHEAGGNEQMALETIRQSLADYRARHNDTNETESPRSIASPRPATRFPQRVSPAIPSPPVTTPRETKPATGPQTASHKYPLKRYVVSIPVPSGRTIVERDTIVKAGQQLEASYAGHWETVTVVAVNDDGTIACSWDNWPGITYTMVREDLTVSDGTAQLETKPSVTPQRPTRKYPLKRYVINIPVPETRSVVGPDTNVEVGARLEACYLKRWETVKVVAINDDGTITCNWDKWPAHTYKMKREDLIIANSR